MTAKILITARNNFSNGIIQIKMVIAESLTFSPNHIQLIEEHIVPNPASLNQRNFKFKNENKLLFIEMILRALKRIYVSCWWL